MDPEACWVCLCLSCKWRGNCAEQMRYVCDKESSYVKLQCPIWEDKIKEEEKCHI